MATREELIEEMEAAMDAIVDATQEAGGAYMAARLVTRMGALETEFPNHLTDATEAQDYLEGAQAALGASIAEMFEPNAWLEEFLGAIADGILLQSAGLDPHPAVRVLSVSNITLSGLQTIDGITLVDGDRVGVIGQSAGAENGIWVAHSGAWTRAGDMDASGELRRQSFFAVTAGTLYEGSSWICTTADPIVLGTTATNWELYQSSLVLSAGAGITRTGNVFDVGAGTGIQVNADSVQIDPAWAGQAAITTVGTITTGTWTASVVGPAYGGTGLSSFVAGDLIQATGTTTLARFAANATSSRLFLTSVSGGISYESLVDADIPSTLVRTSRTISTTTPLSGGGDLSSNRTLSIGGLSSLGSTNQIVGVNAAASGWEYKSLAGVNNRTTVNYSPGSISVDIASNYAGQNTITTVGTIGTGVWNGSPITTAYGGTGLSSFAVGDILYGAGLTTIALLAGNTSTQRRFLSQTGNGTVSAAPSWQAVTASDLPVANLAGTTNQISLSASGTGVLIGTSITLSLPQNIHTGATPTFAGLTLSGLAGTGTRITTSTSAGVQGNATTIDGNYTFAGTLTLSSPSITYTANRILVTNSSGLVVTDSDLTWDASTNALVITGTTSISSTLSVAGSVAFGASSPSTAIGLLINKTDLLQTSQSGLESTCTFSSAATTQGIAGYFQLRTAAASFTMANGYGIRIVDASKGVGSTITTQYGLKIENQTQGGTNYAIHTGAGLVTLGGAVSMGSTLLVAGQTTLTGLTISGGSSGQGNVYSSSSLGFNIQARTGSSYDFSITRPGGAPSYLLRVPTGTATIEIPGNLSVGVTTTLAGLTSSGDILFSASRSILQNTSDGSDNRVTHIGGGGNASSSRGAYASFYGNEHASNAGQLILSAGATGSVYLNTNGVTRYEITSGGAHSITGAATFSGALSAASLTLSSTPLAAASGGTGSASYDVGDILYASGTATLSRLGIGVNGELLRAGPSGPEWNSPSYLGIASSNNSGSAHQIAVFGGTDSIAPISGFTHNGTTFAIGSNFSVVQSSGNTTIAGSITATSTAAITGLATLSGGALFNTNASSAQGKISKVSGLGLSLRGISDSITDFSIMSADNGLLIGNPAGTRNLSLGHSSGTVSVATALSFTSDITASNAGFFYDYSDRSLSITGNGSFQPYLRLSDGTYDGHITIGDAAAEALSIYSETPISLAPESVFGARFDSDGIYFGPTETNPTSRLMVDGSFSGKTLARNSNATLGEQLFIELTASCTQTLPAASSCPGRAYFIYRNHGGSNSTISAGGGNIDANGLTGQASIDLTYHGASILIVSNGSKWIGFNYN